MVPLSIGISPFLKQKNPAIILMIITTLLIFHRGVSVTFDAQLKTAEPAKSSSRAETNIIAALVVHTTNKAPNLQSNGSTKGSEEEPSRNLQGSWIDECTALVRYTQYGIGSNSNKNYASLVCATPSGARYKVDVSTVWIKQKVKDGELISGTTKLVFANGTTVDTSTGIVNTTSLPSLIGNSNNGRKTQIRHLATIGSKTVLLVRVQASNAVTGFSNAQLSDGAFGTNGDPINLKTQYESCSYGQLQMGPAVDRASRVDDGNINTNIVNGATTVTIAATVGTDNDIIMKNQVTAALNAQFRVLSPKQLADHVMYCLPPNSFDGIAYSYVNDWLSVYKNDWCTYVSVQMHEVGHNLGLAHSNEAAEYDDQSGMMGYSYNEDDTPQMCFNAAKSWQLGWYSGKTYTIQSPSSNPPADTGTSYVGKLQGIVDYTTSSNAKVLIKINTASGDDYFINFNARKGINIGTQEGGDQIMIVTAGLEGLKYAPSTLVAKLSAGGRYQIADLDGSGMTLTVEVLAINVSEDAEISICLGDCPNHAAPNAALTADPTKSLTAARFAAFALSLSFLLDHPCIFPFHS